VLQEQGKWLRLWRVERLANLTVVES
jgi:muconolactone delta-isomerase